MIVLRIYEGVAKHFPARRSEWVLAGIMVAWGNLLLLPGPIFDQSTAWAPLAAFAPESVWGWGAVSIGAFRLFALLINGTFHTSWYGRYSPHVRMFASFFSCFVWTQLSWGLFNGPHLTTGLAIYPGLLLLDLMNVVAAAGDAAEMDKARIDGR